MGFDAKPIIVVSRCLGFEPCRYNGSIENNAFVDKLKEYVEFITICPEVDGGLSTPRDSIRIVSKDDKVNLMSSKDGTVVTEKIQGYTNKFLSELKDVDGFILKSKSPTCGVKDAKVYPDYGKCCSLKRGKGFFTEEASKRFSNSIIEDEGRLTNFKIREHFLTRIYILADFREVKKDFSVNKLRKFHQKNTLLFLAYSQKYSKLLDNLVYSDDTNEDLNTLIKEYEFYMYKLLERAPRYTSNINVLLKSIDQFKEKISEEEMQFIWNTIDKYKKAYVPFSVPLYLVKGYIIRFNLDNLLEQTFFMPYPEDLIIVNDSGKMIH